MVEMIDVFGIRTTVSEHSYVDRGKLDEAVGTLSRRDQHIALKGESKSGKSWLRQRIFPASNIVQCRIKDSVENIYRQVLANLEISITVEKKEAGSGTLSFEGTAEAGWKFLAKVSGAISMEGNYAKERILRPVGRDEFDIEFFCSIVKASERRIVIEDFHYLSNEQQRHLAHDLKSLWDYGVYVVVVGIWHRKNYLTYLNSDLSGRITEVSVDWNEAELKGSFLKGCAALNVFPCAEISERIAKDSYNNIGILQTLAANLMDAYGIHVSQSSTIELVDVSKLDDAGMAYADQLEAVYSLFAERVSDGIRKRKDATQIYAFALWVVMESNDEEAISGLSLDWIYEKAHAKQPRIQKPNLRAVLRKFKGLQEDDRGKGVVLSFDEATDMLVLIDKGILFYRKYTTQSWPWEKIAIDAQAAGTGIEGED